MTLNRLYLMISAFSGCHVSCLKNISSTLLLYTKLSRKCIISKIDKKICAGAPCGIYLGIGLTSEYHGLKRDAPGCFGRLDHIDVDFKMQFFCKESSLARIQNSRNMGPLCIPASLRMYSMVNQVMQTASTMARWTLSVASPVSSSTPCRSGSVFSVIPIVDVMMNVIEIRLTI